MPITDADVLQH